MIQKPALRICALILTLLPLLSRAQSLSLNVPGPDAAKVYLEKLDVDVKVTGNIASTTWTMVFRNETSRQLEAELSFPLADGLTVSRYAIDINGKMREAVPVDKAKGTTVLEAIENRRVDPGLLERVEGNAFRTRIYPLPPNGIRTVVIGYEETLHGSTAGQLDYRLPLSFDRPVPKVEINVSSLGRKPLNAGTGAGFDNQGYSWSAQKSLRNYSSGAPLQFLIPQSEKPTALMEANGNNYYVLINSPVRTGSRERRLPDELSIYWDASLSRLGRNADAEMKLLDAYFKKIGNACVSFVAFSNVRRPAQAFTVKTGNWDALRAAISGLVYDGGTQLDRLDMDLPGKEVLLFSDGLKTYGEGTMRSAKVPVFAITSSPRSDFGMLRGLAQSSGGALIDLSSRSLPDAITALTTQELQLIGIRPDKDIEAVYPDVAAPASGGLALTAITHKAYGNVVLQYGYGKEVTQELRVELNAGSQKAPGANLGRIWAMQKIAALDLNYQQNRQEIERLGRRFRLVTRNTSLIVLETLADYLRYKIEPPEELRRAYEQALKARVTETKEVVIDRLEEAEETFKELLDWWREKRPKKPAAPGRISGRLTDTHNNAVSGASIQLLSRGQVVTGSTTTTDGRYSFDALTTGSYTVRFSVGGRQVQTGTVSIAPGQSRELNGKIRLPQPVVIKTKEPAKAPRRPAVSSTASISASATITGTLKDERGSPIVNAYVEITRRGVVTGREVTDFDGNYTVRPLDTGRYDVFFKFQGKELRITDVSLAANQLRVVNGSMTTMNTAAMRDVVVQSAHYTPPLIESKSPGGYTTKSAEQIEANPLRNSLDIAALSTQTYNQSRGGSIAVTGARSSGTKIIIDGVQQNPGAAGFVNLAPGSIEAVTTFSSGVPRSYGQDSGGGVNVREPAAGIRTFSYDFDAASLEALQGVAPAEQYAKYLELRESSMHIPAFYFQAAAHFIARGQKDLGLRILSNLAELDLENYELYKSLGYKLRELGEYEAAAQAFGKVVAWRPMDPQSLRDYGLALADQGRYQAALDTLYSALTMNLDASLEGSNEGIDETLICDINGLISRHRSALNLARIPRSLIHAIPTDIRIVLNWNMKNTDIDLWVDEPDGTRCFYGNDQTEAGGTISNDMTEGFGPEQFMLRRAPAGTYEVRVNYYGNTQVKISGPTVVSAEIYTNWGTPKEQRRMITMQMKPTDNSGVLIGEFTFGKSALAAVQARH